MDELRFKELVDSYTAGLCSAEEIELLESWYLDLAKKKSIAIKDRDWLEQNKAMIWQAVEAKTGTSLAVEQIKKKPRAWIGYAAAAIVLVTLGIGTYRYTLDHSDKGVNPKQFAVTADIAPGQNGATLTLASGKKITLGDAANGELAKEAGVVVNKTANGEIIYTITDGKASGPGGLQPAGFNTLSTAKGETYSVELPDGSKVWLNAASSLKYPSSFAALKERRVELVGEAYFEVAKMDSKGVRVPFIVKTVGQQIEVLGTHFNVNAYDEEPATKTTLLEGSVRVSVAGGVEKILRPGQQASVPASGSVITARSVDAQDAIAWKQGDFIFNGDDLQMVMRQLSRWYNVKVEYQGNVSNIGFVSTISRTKKLSEVLKVLQMTQGAHFRISDPGSIEERRIIVMP